MSSDADRFWEHVAGKLRKKKGYCPPTPEEAQAIMDGIAPEPLSDERISEIVEFATAEEEVIWQEEGALEGADELELQIHRKKGKGDAKAKKTEQEMEEEMLNDEQPKEDKA